MRITLPLLLHVNTIDRKGYLRLVCRVEACRADNHINLDFVPIRVNEALLRDLTKLVSKHLSLLTLQCLQISITRRWPPTSNEEIRRHDVLHQVRSVLQQLSHLPLTELPRFLLRGTAVHNKAEPLVQLSLNHLAVRQIAIGICPEEIQLLLIVLEVRTIGTSKGLREAGGDPDLVSDPMIDLGGGGIYVGQDLDC
jgi:hypothetical protein